MHPAAVSVCVILRYDRHSARQTTVRLNRSKLIEPLSNALE
jgi:hypothetical protein